MSVVGDEVLPSVGDEVVVSVGDEVVVSVGDEVVVSVGDEVVVSVGDEVVVSGVVGKGIVALGLTRVGYGIVEESNGPKHTSSPLCGKFSQVNISGH